MLNIKDKYNYRILIIGGSAGSFPVVSKILETIPSDYRLPIVMCLHRLKDKREGFKEALEIKSTLPVEEPNDKDPILGGRVYIAPANYHLLIENETQFSLATTELVQYSRPSIDVFFESAGDVCKKHTVCLLLSGANRDGAHGMLHVRNKGGLTIAQDPNECSMSTMPQAAIDIGAAVHVLKLDDIYALIRHLQ